VDDPNVLDKETLLPVHGLVRLSKRELRVIDHPAVQRLFEIHQLGQTHFIYRGATHARGEHAVGTLEVSSVMLDALVRNQRAGQGTLTSHWNLGVAPNPTEIAFARLGSLLHDVGHLPAGHTLEDELGLLEPHDAYARLQTVFSRKEWHGRAYDSLSERVDSLYPEASNTGLRDEQTGHPLSASEVVVRLISKDFEGQDLSQDDAARGFFRWEVLRDLIGNTICADLIDYLHRDWLHLGKPRNLEVRLFEYLEIRSRKHPSTEKEQHSLVMNLGTGRKPRSDAVTAVIDLLESRYQLSEIALFHRVKLVAAAMLERVFAEYQDSFGEDPARRGEAMRVLESLLLQCSDPEVYTLLSSLIDKQRKSVRDPEARSRLEHARELASGLRVRCLHKEFASFWSDLPLASWVRETYAGDPKLTGSDARNSKQKAAKNRLLAIRNIEADFGLPPCSIVMYCPPGAMNSKIARVKVFRNNHISPLNEIDREAAGGHLAAQASRFERLWRISFALDRDFYDLFEADPARFTRLVRAIRFGVLNEPVDYGSLDGRIWALSAEEYGRENVISETRIASHRFDAALTYPSGARALRSFRTRG